jgi:hypothetical protein
METINSGGRHKKGNAAFKVAVYAHIPIENKEAEEKTLAQQVVSGL